MMKFRICAVACVMVGAAVACEQAAEPPPEAPPGPSAVPTPPEPSATTPVASAVPNIDPPPTVPPEAREPAGGGAPSPAPATTEAPSAPGAKEHHAATKATATPAGAAPTAAAPAPATAAASGSSTAGAVDDPCQTKNFHYSQVASACKSGGRKAAKGVMKGAVQKAKAAGTPLQCTSCHEDTKDFHLKSNAVGDLKNWL